MKSLNNFGSSYADRYISGDFDELNIIASANSQRAMVKQVPHCDCREANIAAGKPVTVRAAAYDEYDMVPTASRDGEHCDHCGYHVRMQEPVGTLTEEAEQAFVAKTAEMPRGVYGLVVATGAFLEFKTAHAAAKAGFPSVHHALRRPGPLHGILWRRVGVAKRGTAGWVK